MSNRSRREFQTTGLNAFYNAMKRLELSERQLCEKIGYSKSAYTGWLKSGKMPLVASLACEGLVRRLGQEYKEPDDKGNIVVIVKCAELDDFVTLKKIISALPGYEFVRLDCRNLTLEGEGH